MTTNGQPPALLLGIDRLLGLQLSRILWRRGVPVIGAAVNLRSACCRTRSAARIVPSADIMADPVPLLQEIVRKYGPRPVVIPCADQFVWWLNDHRETVNEYADFLLPAADTLQLLADKGRFYRHAMEHELPLPPTRFVTTAEELEAAAREMTFPLLVKPPRRTPEWMETSGGFKVLKVDDAAGLMRIGPDLQAVAGELILQTWVQGVDAGMHSLYVCLDRQSNPLTSCIVAKKIRQWPPDVGVGALAVETRADEVVHIGLGILQKLGYVGPGSLQFKQDEVSGKFYIIEMNTRFGLNFPLFEACGIEMTYTCYCAAAGLPLPENRTVLRPGSKWIGWKGDLASAYVHWRRGELTVREWLKSLRGHKWSADVQLDDPMPLLADIGRKITGGPSRAGRKVLLEQKPAHVMRTSGNNTVSLFRLMRTFAAGLPAQLRQTLFAVTAAVLFCLLVLGTGLILSKVEGVPPSHMTRDALQVLDGHCYTGFISSLGILFWTAAATACLGTAAVLRGLRAQKDVVAFYLCFGLLTLVLTLDDLFLGHERIWPILTGLPQWIVSSVYALAAIGFVARFQLVVLKSRWLLLGLGMAFLGVSAAMDVELPNQHHSVFVEDSFKLLGIVFWTVYFLGCTIRDLRDARGEALTGKASSVQGGGASNGPK